MSAESPWVAYGPPRRPAAAFLALAVLLVGAASDARAQATGIIAGTVVARADGQAVTGAVVQVDGADLFAVTNAVGRFTLDAAPAGRVV